MLKNSFPPKGGKTQLFIWQACHLQQKRTSVHHQKRPVVIQSAASAEIWNLALVVKFGTDYKYPDMNYGKKKEGGK